MFSVFFRDGEVRNYDDAQAQDVAGVRGVLPLDAEPGRAPAAERVRVVVRQRQPTTTPPSTGSSRDARGGPRGRRVVCDNRVMSPARPADTHRGAPAAPRRGPQPRGRPLRPARRLPPLRARSRRWPRLVARPPRRRATWPAWSRPRCERAQETAAPIAAPHGLSDHHRRPGHRGGQLLRGQDVRRRATARLRRPAHWPKLVNPFRPSWGEPYEEIAARMLAAIADARDARPRPRGRHRLPPAARVDRPPPARGQAAVARPAPAASARLASLTTPDLRRRRADVDRLLRARCRAAARCQTGRWAHEADSSCGVAAVGAAPSVWRRAARTATPLPRRRSSGDQKGYISGDGSIETLAPGDRGTALDAGGHDPGRPRWSVAAGRRQGRRAQRLGHRGARRAWPRRPTCRRRWRHTPRPGSRCSSWGSTTATPARARRRRSCGRTRSPTPRWPTTAGAPSWPCGARRPTPPTTLVLDRQGRLAARVAGQVSRATLDGLVDDVLGEGA